MFKVAFEYRFVVVVFFFFLLKLLREVASQSDHRSGLELWFPL